MHAETSFKFNKDSLGETNAAIIRVERENVAKFYYRISYSESKYRALGITQRTTWEGITFNNASLQCAYKDCLPMRQNYIKQCYSPFYNSLANSDETRPHD